MAVVVMSEVQNNILPTLVATGRPLDPATLKAMAYVDTSPHSPGDAFTAFTAASFTGYADISSVTWDAPYTDLAGDAVLVSNNLTWVATDAAHPCTVTGILLYSEISSVKLPLLAYPLSTPVPVANSGQGFTFTAEFALAAGNDYGDGQLIS